MTEAEEEIENCMMVRGLASKVSIEKIMECDLPEDFRQALLVWKLYDMMPVGQA